MTLELMEDASDKLTADVRTTEELNALLADIEEASRWVYKGGGKPLGEKLSGKVSEGFRQKLAKLEGSGALPSLAKEMSDFLKNLEKTLEKTPVLKLKLAFLPKAELLDKLSDWVRKQAGKRVFFDIEVKEDIIGGCIFEYEGEYRDYTLGAKLESVLEQEIRRVT